MGLEGIKSFIKNCGGCGMCMGPGPVYPFREGNVVPEKEGTPSHPCPMYERYKFASASPRGLLYLAVAAGYGKIPVTSDLVQRAYQCLTCGICDDLCYINKMQAVHALREEIVERKMGPLPANLAVDEQILQKNNYFGLPAGERGKWAEGLGLTTGGDLLFFAGCFGSYRYPGEARMVVRILQKAGIKVAHLGNQEICCGAHPFWDGNTGVARTKAAALIRAIEKTGISEVVVNCGECYRALGEDYEAMMGSLPFQVTHVSVKMAGLFREGRLKGQREIRKSVSYHDPCRLFNHFQIGDQPRDVLQRIPGIDFREIREGARWSSCCGSGGMVIQNAFPEFTESLALKRLTRARAAAPSLVTNCPHCFDVLGGAAKKHGVQIEVQPLVGLVGECLGLT